jgi:hypothetical protein
LLPALTTGSGLTVTITVSVLIQPLLFVPVTAYVVVAVGDAKGDAQAVQERPVDGLHTYVLAPEAESVVDVPAQTAVSLPALTAGNGFTVRVNVAVPVQPTPDVPVTV